jgi:hypothetical protein
MKPTCYANTNTYKYTFINMSASWRIIPLKLKLYYDEKKSSDNSPDHHNNRL